VKKFISLLFVSLYLLTACGTAPAQTAQPDSQSAISASSVPTQTSAPQAPMPTEMLPTATLDSVELAFSQAQVTYYDISGSTEAELRAQMTALGPVDPHDNNKHVDAYVDWNISWNWPGYGTSDCDLSSAEVGYELSVTMPRWTPSADANPELVAKWENYIRALKTHEAGHLENIINNYQTVLTAIQSATCDTADAAATTSLETLRKSDAVYDSETNHGATQGAVFP
jgi:predicted secreted Zn-dependent protease